MRERNVRLRISSNIKQNDQNREHQKSQAYYAFGAYSDREQGEETFFGAG
jgi:hypothetical protein